jgi:ABC-2 type transport system permease protein
VSVLTSVTEVTASRELLANLTLRELRSRYKKTALGWGWSLLNPLASMLIFTVVFGVLLRIKPTVGAGGLHSYALFLLCALLPWNFMVGGMTGGMGAIVGNANLINKTYFPRQILVIATVLSVLVTFGIEMGVLAAAFLAFGSMSLPWIPPVIVTMLVLAVFTTGLALGLSVANVYFRDLTHLIGILVQVWFYITPIIYPMTYVTAHDKPGTWVSHYHILDIYQANPMVGFSQVFRDLLYEHHAPSLGTCVYLVVISLVVFVAGLALFNRLEGRMAEEL